MVVCDLFQSVTNYTQFLRTRAIRLERCYDLFVWKVHNIYTDLLFINSHLIKQFYEPFIKTSTIIPLKLISYHPLIKWFISSKINFEEIKKTLKLSRLKNMIRSIFFYSTSMLIIYIVLFIVIYSLFFIFDIYLIHTEPCYIYGIFSILYHQGQGYLTYQHSSSFPFSWNYLVLVAKWWIIKNRNKLVHSLN